MSPRSIFLNLANAVRAFRRELGRSQASLAKEVDLSTRHIQKIEAARTNPSLSVVEDVAKALSVPSCYLVRDGNKSALSKLGIKCVVELLDLVPIGIQVIETEGKVVYINQGFLHFLGYESGEMGAEKFFWSFASSEDEQMRLKKEFEEFLKGTSTKTFLLTSQNKSGEEVKLQADLSKLDHERPGVLAIIRPMLQME